MQLLLFYGFAAIAVLASLFVIGQRNAMYSVLLLIASFGGLSGLYVLLDAPFVAVIQIIIYAGAIMVLFLFVVMLLNVPTEEGTEQTGGLARGLGIVLAFALVGELIWAFWRSGDSTASLAGAAPAVSSVRDIGVVLYTEYAFAFEATSILILVALIGAVVLARKES
jgi:NADH-quinone oxidoreductase subunit J